MKAEDIMEAVGQLDDSVVEESAQAYRIKRHGAGKVIIPMAAVFFILVFAVLLFIKEEKPVTVPTAPTEILPPMGEGVFIPEADVDESIFLCEEPDFSLPVYKNHYPVGMGGVQYEVTDEIKKEITDRFFYFSGLSGENITKHYWADEKNAVYMGYSETGSKIIAGASHISVDFTGAAPDADINKAEVIKLFNENACLKAMGEMAGIRNPQIYMHKTHTYDGKLSNEIYIYEKGSDPAGEIINSSLRSICIRLYEQQNFYSFTLSLNDLSETVRGEKIPFDYAGNYSGFVLYYDKTGEYFMPCCRFYIKVSGGYETSSAPLYRVIE